jgi:prephenate dehydratase
MYCIVYPGMKGSFSYLTARRQFGDACTYVGVKTFREVFEFVETNAAQYGIIPLENSLAGSVYENYDWLLRYQMNIIAEFYTKVEHCLLAVKDGDGQSTEAAIQQLQKILSHPKALEQCRKFFSSHPWIEAVAYRDTAASAAEVARLGDHSCAAIASSYAAELYGLRILQKNLEDDALNYTRFVCVSKTLPSLQKANKCSLLFTLKHIPKAFLNVLKVFSLNNLNVTKITSRPIKDKPFEYIFYMDMEGDIEIMKQVLEKVKNKTEMLKCLGFYQADCLWKN